MKQEIASKTNSLEPTMLARSENYARHGGQRNSDVLFYIDSMCSLTEPKAS